MDQRGELVENVAGQEKVHSHRPSAIPIQFCFINYLIDLCIPYKFPFVPLLEGMTGKGFEYEIL
jgi:hypothetical protein